MIKKLLAILLMLMIPVFSVACMTTDQTSLPSYSECGDGDDEASDSGFPKIRNKPAKIINIDGKSFFEKIFSMKGYLVFNKPSWALFGDDPARRFFYSYFSNNLEPILQNFKVLKSKERRRLLRDLSGLKPYSCAHEEQGCSNGCCCYTSLSITINCDPKTFGNKYQIFVDIVFVHRIECTSSSFGCMSSGCILL